MQISHYLTLLISYCSNKKVKSVVSYQSIVVNFGFTFGTGFKIIEIRGLLKLFVNRKRDSLSKY